jgi:hypothetical protein
MKFSRRIFVQGVTASLISYWGWQKQSILPSEQLNAYAATLNQASARKLALLVGINQYSSSHRLKGCKTDVELQKELLIHRFGFQPQDIITLIDQQASKKQIITSFNEHLQQASQDDVVVFHFSGYGRKVQINDSDGNSKIVKSLIAYDTVEAQENQVDDLLLDTLIKLAENLKTKKYTLIVDTSFIPPSNSIQKQISLRGYKYDEQVKISNKELELNQTLSNNSSSLVNISPKKTKLSGAVFLPPSDNIAVEIKSSDFSCGLFTYTLSQSLWTLPTPVNQSNLQKQIITKTALYSNNNLEPTDLYFPTSINSLNYHLPFVANSQGIGIITKILEGNSVELKLLGLPLLLLFNYGINSLLTASIDGENTLTIQVNSLTGNIAKGTIIKGDINLVKSGLVVRELVRIIPPKLGLNIGLNDNLNKVEKVDATSALSTIDVVSFISTVSNNFVDYILDKSTADNHQGYSLYSPTGMPLKYTYPTTEHEGVYSAVKRLEEFRYLDFDLAYKLLNLTDNEYTSTLALSTSLQVNSKNAIAQFTKYTSNAISEGKSPQYNEQLISIPQNSYINLQVSNYNSDNLYYLIFEVNSSKEIFIYNNPQVKTISAGEKRIFPKDDNSFKWFVNGNKGLGELIILCSKSPFNKTFQLLTKNNGLKLQNEQVLLLKNPVDVAKLVLEDLHLTSHAIHNENDVYSLDMNNWLTFKFAYQII